MFQMPRVDFRSVLRFHLQESVSVERKEMSIVRKLSFRQQFVVALCFPFTKPRFQAVIEVTDVLRLK